MECWNAWLVYHAYAFLLLVEGGNALAGVVEETELSSMCMKRALFIVQVCCCS